MSDKCEKCIAHGNICEAKPDSACEYFLKKQEEQLRAHLRTLAYMSVGCPEHLTVKECKKDDCIDCKIDYAIDHPTEE